MSEINLEQLTATVCQVAKDAGDFLRKERLSFQANRIEEKSANNFVTYVDKAAEELIVERLNRLLEDASFITEEKTVSYKEKDYCWIIDPLDGTTNFIYDNAPYCVSIALSFHSDILLGVVYEVCRDECFYAWKNGNSYLNGKKIHVSTVDNFDNSFIGLGLPYNSREFKPVIINLMNELYGRVNGLRINGSAAISLCNVAVGRFDVYAEAFINIWDFAAGALIVQEAGGKVTNFTGNGDFLKGHHIVSSNGLIHKEMIDLLSPFESRFLEDDK
ncbi:MAG: inositol monophosphatase [Prevotella sp.]|jgi:myo-inositol-1(or 4)-monophosphatase|nr:inositol monophosphatase [Prevotella sp.]